MHIYIYNEAFETTLTILFMFIRETSKATLVLYSNTHQQSFSRGIFQSMFNKDLVVMDDDTLSLVFYK